MHTHGKAKSYPASALIDDPQGVAATREDPYAYTFVKSGPDVDPSDVEASDRVAIEITIAWGASVLHVAHLDPPRSFYVGEEKDKSFPCDYFLPAEKLGAVRVPIVIADEGEAYLVVPRGARGAVELPGRPAMTLAEAARAGLTRSAGELAGAQKLALPLHGRASVEIEGFVFRAAVVPAGKAIANGVLAGTDWNAVLYAGLSLAVHVGLLATFAAMVPPQGIVAEEGMSRDQQYLIQQYLEASAQREQESKNEPPTPNDTPSREGGNGGGARGAEGAMGNPTSREANHRYGIEGPADNADPRLAREHAIREAREFGMIGLLAAATGGDPDAPTAPWGGDESLGNDPQSALGSMWGDTIGEAYGVNGLGLTGVGEGGGRSGLGIGLASVGNHFGHALGDGIGDGIGSGTGRLRRGHATGAPSVRPAGETRVNGRIVPEVIQRIVRQNYGRFRLCYENGLRSNPNLQGRVAVRFVIGRDGAVSSVSNGGSDLPNDAVVQCVVRAYYGLSFPEPEGGIVTVTYPIMFSPGE